MADSSASAPSISKAAAGSSWSTSTAVVNKNTFVKKKLGIGIKVDGGNAVSKTNDASGESEKIENKQNVSEAPKPSGLSLLGAYSSNSSSEEDGENN